MSINIAIDGPAGAGKSTVAKLLAKKLGYVYVDTGAMYRAMGIYFSEKGIDPKDEEAVGKAASEAEVSLRFASGQQRVYLNGDDVTDQIRTEAAGNMASATSVYPKVREKLTAMQKELAAKENVVMDGRDIGTVVLPQADLKVFLTASSMVRGKRRFDELVAKGEVADLPTIIRDIEKRDELDKNRETAPLKKAEDAYFLDSSSLTIDAVLEKILEQCREKGILQSL